MIGTSIMRRSSLITLRKSFLKRYKADFAFLIFFLSGFFSRIFTIHRTAGEGAQDSTGRGKLSFYCFSITSTRFTDTQTLAGLLLQRAHLCPQLAAGIELGTFDFLTHVANHKSTRSLEFALSTLGLAAAFVRRMLKTRVTLRNI